jgi:hypothetical protein
MIRSLCGGLLLCAFFVAPAWAQKSAAADKQAGSWFNNGRDSFLKRMGANLSAGDIDAWEAAGKKAGLEASRQDLFFALPKFNPLFDSSDKLVPGAVAKFQRQPSTSGRHRPAENASLPPSA